MGASRRDIFAIAAAFAAGLGQILTPSSGRAAAAPAAGPSLDEHTEFVLSPSVDPLQLFAEWLAQAKKDGEPLPIAMTLATSDPDGLPDVRMMLHQEVRNGSFLFTSFAGSAKSKELRRNPKAALLFYWNANGRQIRVRGDVRPLSPADVNEAWPKKRSGRANLLRDWAWPQSEVFKDAAELEGRLRQADTKFPGEVPRRDWTGWLLKPRSIEFFLPHPRTLLHERLLFTSNGRGGWRTERLVP
jgi:pyridoxamine 5'-phosphate oxidase